MAFVGFWNDFRSLLLYRCFIIELNCFAENRNSAGREDRELLLKGVTGKLHLKTLVSDFRCLMSHSKMKQQR